MHRFKDAQIIGYITLTGMNGLNKQWRVPSRSSDRSHSFGLGAQWQFDLVWIATNHFSGLFVWAVRPIDWHADRLRSTCQCLRLTHMCSELADVSSEMPAGNLNMKNRPGADICVSANRMWRESQIFAVIRGELEQLCSLCVYTWNATLCPKAFFRFKTNRL